MNVWDVYVIRIILRACLTYRLNAYINLIEIPMDIASINFASLTDSKIRDCESHNFTEHNEIFRLRTVLCTDIMDLL